MPDVSYHYRVRVGPYEWTGNTGDPADYGPVDGLQIIRKLVDTPLWPAQRDTDECRFQLIVESTADVDAIELGTPVYVQITRPVGGAVKEGFAGRVAELTAVPHSLGMLLTLNCLDYTADLRGVTVGAEPWPQESIWDRVVRVIGLASPLPVSVLPTPPGSGIFPINVPDVMPRDVDAQDCWELVQGYLDQWAVDYGYLPSSLQYRGLARMNVVPQNDVDGNLTGWQLQPSFDIPGYTGPLRLELRGGLWTAVPVDTGSASGRVIDGDTVDVAATFAITKADTPTRVAVGGTGLFGEYVVTADLGVVPPVNAELTDAELLGPVPALLLANMYLPGELPVSRWMADSFTWHMELDAAGAIPINLGALVTVGDIPTDQNPNQREWYAGQVSASTFTIADKRPTYVFTMRRPDFDVPPTGTASWSSSAIVTNDVKWNTVNPRDTWDDYRLVRGTLA